MTGCSISVIMPVFNAELYLKYAIDSVLHQSLQDFEFIIINDGSTDASEQIILSYENPRIRYINNIENKGLVYSLNKGIEESIGKYIVRMDADDISLPERFAIQLKFLDDNQQYGLCCSDISTIDANNEIITSEYYGELSAPLEWQMLWENPVAHPTVMMRREFIDTFNFRYDESDFPAEDYGLWCRFILKSPIKRLKETLLYYRISANSIFHSSKARALEKASLVTTQYAHDLTHKCVPQFHSYFYYQGADRSEMLNNVDIKDAKIWLNTIALGLAELHKWESSQNKIVEFDINLKLIKMIFHKRMSSFNKLLSLRHLNITSTFIYLSRKFKK